VYDLHYFERIYNFLGVGNDQLVKLKECTKIGAKGKPIKGSPELSMAQSDVINTYKSKIRSAGQKINNYQKYQKYRKEE
jgi:hypothetical protein